MSKADVLESPSKADADAALEARVAALVEALVTAHMRELHVPVKKACGNCRHWSALHMVKTHGQCMLSARSMPAPAVTPNLACCTGWEAD